MNKELNYKKSWLKILQNVLIVLAIGWSIFPSSTSPEVEQILEFDTLFVVN